MHTASSTRNPYVIGVPLTGDAAFYGRQDLFNFIKDVLDAENQNVIVLYGQRRIGKTSVLHQASKWLKDSGDFFPVYYDLQGKERLSLGAVLENLAVTLARRLDLRKPDAALFDEAGRYFNDSFLPLAFHHLGEGRLVLLFDEFDVLGDELASPDPASETLFPYLQELITNHQRIGFVFVVGRRIEELATHFQAVFKQAAYRRVGLLDPEPAKAVIVEPVRGALSYSEEAVHEILGLTAGHPYFTQLICFEVFNALKANSEKLVTKALVGNVVSRAIESGHGALNWFWEGLPRAERFIMSAVAHVSDKSGVGSKEDVRRLLEEHRILLSGLELKDAPDRLVEWEMLRRDGPDAYGFVVELVRRWIIQAHPLSAARRDIDYVSKRAVRLFENAREAHSEGDVAYARDEYRRALEANPNHSGAQLGLALTLNELGEFEEAIVEFKKAYAIDEMSARDGLVRAQLARAKALEDSGRMDEAIIDYGAVLALAPAEETARSRLGFIWQGRAEAALAAGGVGAARDLFQEMVSQDQRTDALARVRGALITHADQSEASGNLDEAAATYSLLTESLPDDVEIRSQAAALWMRCGDSLAGQKQFQGAISFYEKVLEVWPDDSNVTKELDSAKGKLEELHRVERLFEHALSAHHSGALGEARDGWKKLIQMDVLTYRDHNIAGLLAETFSDQKEAQPIRGGVAGQSPFASLWTEPQFRPPLTEENAEHKEKSAPIATDPAAESHHRQPSHSEHVDAMNAKLWASFMRNLILLILIAVHAALGGITAGFISEVPEYHDLGDMDWHYHEDEDMVMAACASFALSFLFTTFLRRKIKNSPRFFAYSKPVRRASNIGIVLFLIIPVSASVNTLDRLSWL